MKHHHFTRRICILLVLAMILGAFPFGAFAGNEGEISAEAQLQSQIQEDETEQKIESEQEDETEQKTESEQEDETEQKTGSEQEDENGPEASSPVPGAVSLLFAPEPEALSLPEDTWYVSAEGSDITGTGTPEAPFASLYAAYVALANAGDAGTIALLSDIYIPDVPNTSSYNAALYVCAGKNVTITSADADGQLLENEAGNMDGVYSIHRWNQEGNKSYNLNLITVDNGSLTLSQIILDGDGKNFPTTGSTGYLIKVEGTHGDDTLTLTTNSVLQDNIGLGTGGSLCGSAVDFGAQQSEWNPVMYMNDNAAILGCVAPRHGGAITIYDGDVYMSDNATIMYCGIRWIASEYYGGGAILAFRGHLHMSGNATITKNFVNVPAGKDSSRQHNAVQADPSTESVIYLSGNARIFDNYDGTDSGVEKTATGYSLTGTRQANTYAAAGRLRVDGALGSKAKVGVTVKNAVAGSAVAAGSGYSVTADDADAFFDDTNTFAVAKDSGNSLVFSDSIVATTLTLTSLTDSLLQGNFGEAVAADAGDFTIFKNGEKMDSGYTVLVNGSNVSVSFSSKLENRDVIGIGVYKNGYRINNGNVVTKTYRIPGKITIGKLGYDNGKFSTAVSVQGQLKTYSIEVESGKLYLTEPSGTGYTFRNGVVSSTVGHSSPDTTTAYTSVQLEISASDALADEAAEEALESIRYTANDGETFTLNIYGNDVSIHDGDYYIDGHYYTVSSSCMSWEAAMEWAFNLQTEDPDRYPGYRSYPAVITAAEENSMLVNIWYNDGGTRKQIWLPAVPAETKTGTGSITVTGTEGAVDVVVTGEPRATVVTNEYGHGEAYLWLDGTPEAGEALPNETSVMGNNSGRKGTFWSSGNPTDGGSVYFGHPGQGAFWDDITDHNGYGSNVWTSFSGNDSFHMYALAEWEPAEEESISVSASETFSHAHSWSYEADGNMILASCSVADCYLPLKERKLTISAPKSLVADGRSRGAVLSRNSVGGVSLTAEDITYEKKNETDGYEAFDGTPVLAGSYRATITAGGASASVEYTVTTPEFTAQQGINGGNYVELNWEDVPGSKYMVEKAEEDTDYQSISLKTTIKVLNVYPDTGDNLKTWMDTNNLGSPEIDGVQYSMTVDKVSISTFNSNPSAYLGTAGNWKYDVVFFGAYDANCGRDLSFYAYAAVKSFIDCGGGVLFGHDTCRAGITYFNQLGRDYLGIISNGNISCYGAAEVVISRKGLLTNYPYNIGEVGTHLNVPLSHSQTQFSTSDVWMRFVRNTWTAASEMTSYGGQSGTNNFYLTSKNNVAMIQTGHTAGSATLDEQKILVNTLYYLAQASESDSFRDHSAQDLAGPGLLENGRIEAGKFLFDEPEDLGTTYSYKLYGLDDTNGSKIFTGATASAEVITGFAGYSYELSPSASEIGVDNTIEITEPVVDLAAYEGGTCYLHICPVDKAGNCGEEQIFDITHIHEWSYEAEGNTITASCADTLQTCRATDADKILTIIAPVNPIYNESAYPAELSADHVGGAEELDADDINYEMADEDGVFAPISGIPTEPGCYRASITAGGVTASVIYRIRNWRKDLTSSMFTFTAPDGPVYGDGPATAGVVVKDEYTSRIGRVTEIYYQKEGEETWLTQPVEAGTYTVAVSISDDGEIYAGGDGVTFTEWTFTIQPRPVTAAWTETIQEYTGESLRPAAELFGVLEGDEVTVLIPSALQAGHHSLTASLDNSNYILSNPVVSFLIRKTPVSVVISGSILPYDGEPQAPSVGLSVVSGDGDQSENIPMDSDDYVIIYRDKDGNPVAEPVEPGTYTVCVVITNPNFRFEDGIDGRERKMGDLIIYSGEAPKTYTVSFEGGTGAEGSMEAMEAAVEGSSRVLPACEFTKAGQTFTGWLYNGRLYRAGESLQQPAQDVKLTAQWAENAHAAGGIVLCGGPVKGAVVTLMSGSRQAAPQQITGADGTFRFDGVLPGIYNLVVSHDGVTVTTFIVISDADVTDISVELPAGRTSSVVEIAAGSPEIIVDGLHSSFDDTDGNYTPQDAQLVEDGGAVEIKLSVEKEVSPAAEKQETIEKEVSGVALYLNADLSKTTTEADGTVNAAQPLYSSDALISIIVPIPADKQDMASYRVFRYHSPDGTAAGEVLEELDQLSLSAAGTEEGFTVSDDGTSITIYTKAFSLYAVGYVERSTKRHKVSTPVTGRGTVTTSPVRAAKGTAVTITVKPEDGWAVGKVSVTYGSGIALALTDNGDGTYTFFMPGCAVDIDVDFVRALADPACTGVADWLITDRHVPYMSGYTDNTTRPEGNMTRAEAAMVFYRLLKNRDVDAAAGSTGAAPAFSDVKEGAWYADAVRTLTAQGILSGYTDGSFRPDAEITRAEFAVLTMKFAKAAGYEVRFNDITGDFWAADAIFAAAGYGWISGYEDGTFRPEEEITRAQAASIINRMTGRTADAVHASVLKIVCRFADLQDAEKWYYGDMLEAVASGEYSAASEGVSENGSN